MHAYRPDWLWTGTELVRAPVVTVEADGRVGTAAGGVPLQELRGVLLPGLVNAHVHLDLPATDTPSGQGFLPWLRGLRGGAGPSAETAAANARAALAYGTAAVGDISNTGMAEPAARAAGLQGRFFREVLGIDLTEPPDVPLLTPHAPHSTHPAIVRAAAARAAAEGRTWSVHFDEDPEEAAFLREGGGAWPAVLRMLGRDLDAFPVPGLSPAAYLSALGVLDARALLVHAACTRGADLDLLAASGAHVCLCVRSNLHIGGRLPDVPGLLARGVPIALGTDSLASSPDLDPLAEAAACRRAFPDVPAETWLRAITAGAADALALEALGRIAPGAAPGLLLVEVPDPASAPDGAGGRCGGAEPPRPRSVVERLLDGTRWTRRWLLPPA
jgi:cytosine/adenosine deaminase-related metal-dependent hydrolase